MIAVHSSAEPGYLPRIQQGMCQSLPPCVGGHKHGSYIDSSGTQRLVAAGGSRELDHRRFGSMCLGGKAIVFPAARRSPGVSPGRASDYVCEFGEFSAAVDGGPMRARGRQQVGCYKEYTSIQLMIAAMSSQVVGTSATEKK